MQPELTTWEIERCRYSGARHHAAPTHSFDGRHSDEPSLARSLGGIIVGVEGSLPCPSAGSSLVESCHGSVRRGPPGTALNVSRADRLKNGTIAKLASKVSEYYSESLRFAVAAKGAGGVWPLFSFPSVSLRASRPGRLLTL